MRAGSRISAPAAVLRRTWRRVRAATPASLLAVPSYDAPPLSGRLASRQSAGVIAVVLESSYDTQLVPAN